MDKVNGFANQISELYKRASDDFLCNRFVWNEIEDSLCEFREEINKQISEKKYNDQKRQFKGTYFPGNEYGYLEKDYR